jgi:flagellar basal body-associated protein FliL
MNKNFLYSGMVMLCILQLACSKPAEKEPPKPQTASEKANQELAEFLGTEPESYEFIELEPIFVNLPATNGRGGEQYLNVTIVIQLKDSALSKEFEENKHYVRDKITTTLALRAPAELADISIRPTLAKEVALVLNAVFEPEITRAYITYNKDGFHDAANILRLQNTGVLPSDLVSKPPLSSQTIELIKSMKDTDLPIKGVLFKEFRLNRGG